MDSTHIRWLEESLEKNTVQKIQKAGNGRIGKNNESMTEKRNQRELLWFQTGGALNFLTAAPHCGVKPGSLFKPHIIYKNMQLPSTSDRHRVSRNVI
jgi:hypothetical protein